MLNDGFGNDAYGNELPSCDANDLFDCTNYMRAKGYVAIVRNVSSLTLTVPSLPPGLPLHDLFYIQFDHLGWPDDELAYVDLTVQGDPLLAGGPCRIYTNHERDWLTTLGPIIPGSGVWYNHCANAKWLGTFGANSLQDYLYGKYYSPTSPLD